MNDIVIALALSTLALLLPATGSAASFNEQEWVGREAPELATGNWVNSSPLSLKELKGKVVMIEFWTFGCYNCLNTLPHVKAWNRKFTGKDFMIIGVHTPEFEREKDPISVKRAVARLNIEYPVVTDNDYLTWDHYHQKYWPAVYLIDRGGTIRYVHIGEGNYEETEAEINALLAEK